MDGELFKWFATLGVGGVLAGFMFWFYRKDVKSYTEQWKGQSEMLMSVVKENSKAITENTEVTRSFREHLDTSDKLRKAGLS